MSTLQTNIIGTSNLLNIIRSSKNLKSVVIITSDKCYENISKKTYVETDKLGGSDIYSASKSSCELVVSAFRKSFFLDKKINIATARAGNVIGGGDYSQHRIIPDIIKSFEKKKNCIIRNPNHTRPWQHVLDPINGYLKLAEKLYKTKSNKFNSAWNFGPPFEDKTVNDVVKIIKNYINIKVTKKKLNNKYNESKYLNLSSKKSKKYLGWKRKISFQESIKMTVDWHLKINKKEDIIKLTSKQINDYFKIKK